MLKYSCHCVYQEVTAETHSELSSELSSGTEHTSRHTDGPTTANRRKVLLKEWLDSRGIRYADYARKIEIHELIKLNKPKLKTFHVNRKLAQHGHISLGLPPTTWSLKQQNIWDIIKKNWMAVRNVTFKLKD